MADKESRLLTDEEIKRAISVKLKYHATDIVLVGIEKEVAKAQDTKTLKEVGELLQRELNVHGELVMVSPRYRPKVIHPDSLNKIIEALKHGELPEE